MLHDVFLFEFSLLNAGMDFIDVLALPQSLVLIQKNTCFC